MVAIRLVTRYFSCALRGSFYTVRLKKAVEELAMPGQTVPGSSLQPHHLYHDLIIPDRFGFDSHRKRSLQRAQCLSRMVDFRDRRVLDIGCSVGSMTLAAGLFGASRAIGIDHDLRSVRVARAQRDKYRIHNVDFRHRAIGPDNLDLPESDLLIWLSNWMWMVKVSGLDAGLALLFDIPKTTRVSAMVFESAADDGKAAIAGTTQSDIEDFLVNNSPFTRIVNTGPFQDGWRKPGLERMVFVCTEPWYEIRSKSATVERMSPTTVRKTYRPLSLSAMRIEIDCLRRLEDLPYFPSLLEHGDDWIEMSYGGEAVGETSHLAELLDAVEAMNSRGIQHRDICPENLLYGRGGLKVIDFEWAVIDGRKPELEPMEGLGRGFYDPSDTDDRQAARRVLEHFQSQ